MKEDGAKRSCYLFYFEMEHLLGRTGFEVESIYGDFNRHELENCSSDMIWIAKELAII